MMKTILFTLGLLLFASSSPSQTVLWASKVVKASSQYSPKQYGAAQVLGKPNVFPSMRESPCAWSPLEKESVASEFIEVEFASAMSVRQVVIAESFNAGCIIQVQLVDAEGNYYTIHENMKPVLPSTTGRWFRLLVEPTPYLAKGVRVELNTRLVAGWNHIDAIAISDSDHQFTAEINLATDMGFTAKPENLGPNVNSPYDEILPVISPDGTQLYFDRKDHPDNAGRFDNDDIWVSKLSAEGKWERAKNLGEPLNNTGHNFLNSISADGRSILLGNKYTVEGMVSGTSISHWSMGKWQQPQEVVIRNFYNDNKFSEFSISKEGKVLVMTIERKDGFGAKDLHVSFESEGTFSEPMNMGPIVNSAATEMSPFLAADDKTLYFASDGFSGYGNKDIFMTRRLDETWTNWTEPQNLGPSINSKAWDAYFSVPAAGDYGYLCSEEGAIGKTDIYRIPLPKEMQPEVTILMRGQLVDHATKAPVKAGRITCRLIGSSAPAFELPVDVEKGEFGVILPAGDKWVFEGSADGHRSQTQVVDLTDKQHYEVLELNFELDKE